MSKHFALQFAFLFVMILLSASCAKATPEAQKPADIIIRSDIHTLNSIDWDDYQDARFWEVWARPKVNSTWGDWQHLDTTAVSNYAHTTVSPGVTYQYRIRALNRENETMGTWAYAQHTVPTATPMP